ncbi:hypothetical protein E3N88_44818 [Mikania micrantha]|uniref:Uncharacterized protein n=1 Tax=Mikania micrantha TaxID=192012 RepID=A0A5N6LB69_9ASTR|nr:hypothetical protein E3N88_44818 [Mikania micrantha]
MNPPKNVGKKPAAILGVCGGGEEVCGGAEAAEGTYGGEAPKLLTGKQTMKSVVVHDDDDFVDPPKRQTKQKTKTKTSAGPSQQKFVPYTDKKLKARVGVINLKNSVTGLSKQQRKAIKSMGFKPFLSLDIDTIPTRFVQWLVSNYDCGRNELNAVHHYIHVTSQTVKDVLGVPLSRLPINEKNKHRM